MKYIDEYRDPHLAQGLLAQDRRDRGPDRAGPSRSWRSAAATPRPSAGYGIRKLLPENVRLISGPGCPVCVTSAGDVDRALWLAGRKERYLCHIRRHDAGPRNGRGKPPAAPGSRRRRPGGLVGHGLHRPGRGEAGQGGRLHGDRLRNHRPHRRLDGPDRRAEGNSPTFPSFPSTRSFPPALRLLIADPRINLDGFLCPGHVSIMLGSAAYAVLPEAGKAAVITGFEPVDILEGDLHAPGADRRREPGRSRSSTAGRSAGGQPPGDGRDGRGLRARRMPNGAASGRSRAAAFSSAGSMRTLTRRKRFAIPEFHPRRTPGCSCGDGPPGAQDARRSARSSGRSARRPTPSAPAWSPRRAPAPPTTGTR